MPQDADTVDSVTFSGWPASALSFYAGLEADNSKSYWSEHKAVYEADVLAPMNALLAELTEEFGEGKIFRPYRDIRFSADKSPYKTTIAAVLPHAGFIQLSAAGLDVGRGSHGFAPDQLERFRMAVADDRRGEELQRLIADAESRGIQVTATEQLKSVPRGYPETIPESTCCAAKTSSRASNGRIRNGCTRAQPKPRSSRSSGCCNPSATGSGPRRAQFAGR